MNNNRNPDPVELAHRVLGADKVGRDLNNAASWDAIDLVLENAPALAHAVIAAAELHEPACYHSEIAGAGERDAEFIAAALPHLTAEDLRHTDAAEEIRTEGWQQGWAAGRDLDGDVDATPYLRDTPAGRALMAEGWSAALAQLDTLAQTYDEKGDHPMAEDLRFTHGRIAKRNPYRKEGNG